MKVILNRKKQSSATKTINRSCHIKPRMAIMANLPSQGIAVLVDLGPSEALGLKGLGISLFGFWALGLLGSGALGLWSFWAFGLLGSWALGLLGSWALGFGLWGFHWRDRCSLGKRI